MRVLVVTSEWPSVAHPHYVPFLREQVERLRGAGHSIEVFSFRGGNRMANYTLAWRKLRRSYDLTTFDLVHAHFGQSGMVVLPTPLPLVVTFHGSDLIGTVGVNGRYTFQGRLLRAISRFVARRASEVIVVSEHLAQYLRPGMRYSVIPCGIDTELFRPLPRSEARAALGLAAVGRLVLFGGDPANPIKRYDLAKRVVAQVPSHLGAEIVCLKGVPHERVPLYMSACDSLLVTSRHEGSPMVVKEALACGLPIVAVAVGDIGERIAGVDGCALCSSGEPGELASALEAVLASNRRIVGRAAVKAMDHAEITPRIERVYSRSLKAGLGLENGPRWWFSRVGGVRPGQ